MLNPSPSSRILLGTSLTISVALIIVVASSRPSISKQETRLLATERDDRDPHLNAASTSDRRLDQDVQPADGSAETVNSPAGNGPSRSEDPRFAAVENHSPNDGDALPAKQVVISQASDEKVPPLESTDQISDTADRDTTLHDPAEPPRKERAQQEKKQKSEQKQKQEQSEQKQKSEQKQEQKEKSEQKQGDRVDPLKRLSREFARRAAARGDVPVKATPVAPPAHEIFPPSVAMSDEHRKSCIVFVGDSMPDGKLQDNADEVHAIQQSLGKRLTAIVFWNARNPYALDQFEELWNDLVPFRELGVRTIAVHVGPAPADYAELCQQFGQDVLCLADPDRAYFQRVASGRVPRTYLLDASGKIIWLDIEYSRTTRYELRNALHFSLREK